MKIFSINENFEVVRKEADKGAFGEDIYNDRIWSPEEPQNMPGFIPQLDDRIWKYHEDMRGEYYRKEDGQKIIVTIPFKENFEREYNISLDDFMKEIPSEELKYPKWDGENWINDEIKIAKEIERKEIQQIELLISDRKRQIAIDALIKDNILELISGKLKKKK